MSPKVFSNFEAFSLLKITTNDIISRKFAYFWLKTKLFLEKIFLFDKKAVIS